MPGDILAMAVTRSTVVCDGPCTYSAEMQASIKRCRCRSRDARGGALGAFFDYLRAIAKVISLCIDCGP